MENNSCLGFMKLALLCSWTFKATVTFTSSAVFRRANTGTTRRMTATLGWLMMGTYYSPGAYLESCSNVNGHNSRLPRSSVLSLLRSICISPLQFPAVFLKEAMKPDSVLIPYRHDNLHVGKQEATTCRVSYVPDSTL